MSFFLFSVVVSLTTFKYSLPFLLFASSVTLFPFSSNLALETLTSTSSKLNARRKIMRNVNKVKDADGKNVDIPTKLFDEIAPKYKDVKGGYTRIIKKGQRRGDAAETVILELI